MSEPVECVNCDDGSEHFNVKHEEYSEGEDIHMHVQEYLAHNYPTTNCCGLAVPIAFERAAPGTWWNPRFDSEILEGQYRRSSFRQIRLRFRFALLYILIFSVSWFAYFVSLGLNGKTVKWPSLCSIFGGVLLVTSVMLYLTFTNIYKTYTFKLSLIFALALCILSLSLVSLTTQMGVSIAQVADISQSGHFTICIEILLIIYTLTPLPLYTCVIIGVFYSIVFEILNVILHLTEHEWRYPGMVVRILLQLCVHIIGVHIYLMTFVRMRGAFMKVGQSLLVRQQLEMEKQLKEKMIHSVMPPKLASHLMKEQVFESETNLKTHNALNHRTSNQRASDLKSLFRPFNMTCMDNVSILFADIVGFTRMSSNKGAEELVSILNDLFEKFDELCRIHGCEKISTLGDCYYCISGCPEPRPDHATCCVEMGLGMIQAIQEFDRERGEGINMRVGVHTGTVLCGIVGTRRFKFDVWSNDVSFANKMESSGKPGRVHISEETSHFIGGSYVLEEGEAVFGHKTYFIEGRQLQSPYDHDHTLTPSNPINLRLIISPAASPQSVLSINHPPIPTNSFKDQQSSHRSESNNFLSPNPFNCRAKASSLPSILDSDAESDEKQKGFPGSNENSSKSPTSIGSYGKYTTKLKNWKIPRFLRKHSDTPLHVMKKQDFNDKAIIFLERGDNSDVLQSTTNGYQQVPILIESQDNKGSMPVHTVSKLNTPQNQEMAPTERDTIDIRSYLSQSRSNMSPFARSSSYRSQYGRPSPLETPVSRARSSTLTTHGELSRPKDRRLELPLAAPSAPARAADDAASLCPSVNSRKDSGIRSTSRRSSIQHQIFALNQTALAASRTDIMQHRVSGYYTSSQSSLNEPSRSRLPPPLKDQPHESPEKLRKQSDLLLIRCVQDNAASGVNYFVQPPLNRFTLSFKSPNMEQHYREKAHRSDDCENFPPTLTTSRFNTALDIIVSAIIFLTVSASIFMLYIEWQHWLGWFIFFILIETLAIILCIYRHYLKWKTKTHSLTDLTQSNLDNSNFVTVFKILTNWYCWHVCGCIVISLPILCVLINFSCKNTTEIILVGTQPFYVYLLCVSVVHFCNFTQMCWLVKNTLVTLYAGLFLFLVVFSCHHNTQLTITDVIPNPINLGYNFTDFLNVTGGNITEDFSIYGNYSFNGYAEGVQLKVHLYELYIDVALLLILVWFLNREFEISYRLSFYSNDEANRDRVTVQNMRNQADWLLHNIIPKHVADQLKESAKYSENHKDVGIIFASIVNFNEMYDESYLKGKEYLRVLNELIADFDELLERPEFQHIEKIKTIGSTFMAASGLNPGLRRSSQPYDHLYQLMNFAIEMQKVVDNFNQDLLEFDFILRIGYNFGDVTAGVIGTTKLYYDIWGDAVNIASRMDSTGVAKRIQVGEACVAALANRYEFEPRGSVYVKGKDNMNVYLLVGKKDAV